MVDWSTMGKYLIFLQSTIMSWGAVYHLSRPPPFFEVRTFFNFMLLHILVYGEEQNTGLKFTLTNRHEVHVDVSDLI